MEFDFKEFASRVSDQKQLKILRNKQEIIEEKANTLGVDPTTPLSAIDPEDDNAKELGELKTKMQELQQLEFYLYLNSEHENVKEILADKVDEFITKNLMEANNPDIKEPWDIAKYHELLYLSSFGGEFDQNGISNKSGLMYKFNATNEAGENKYVSKETMAELNILGLTNGNSELTLMGQAVLKRLNEDRGLPAVAAEEGYTIPTAG